MADKTENKNILEKKARLAMRGDMAAFEEICAAKRGELYFTALTMLSSKEDAEDAVQNTMLGMFRNIGKLKKAGSIHPWMHKILHDNCVNIIRKKGRQVSTVPLGDDLLSVLADKDGDVEPEKIAGDREMLAELHDAIRVLPEKSREVLVLYYFNEMKYKDIAKVTNTSIQTVSTNLIRAKKHLKIYFKERHPEMASLMAALPALHGLKLHGGTLIGKHLFAASSNLVTHAAAGVAGVVCAAAVTYTVLAAPAYEITLVGDCDCGHINPKSIELKGARAGDSPGEWELLARDGSAIFAGSLDSVTDYIQKLEKTRRDGRYKLRCVITSKNGARYAVSRGITIGDFAGDE